MISLQCKYPLYVMFIYMYILYFVLVIIVAVYPLILHSVRVTGQEWCIDNDITWNVKLRLFFA